MTRWVPLGWWLCVGCGPAIIEGELAVARGVNAPEEGATVTLYDDGFEVFATATTNASGVFEIEAPRASTVHLVFETEDGRPIAFPGDTGVEDRFVVPTGTFWAFPPSEDARWREDFAGCPGADGDGAMWIGEVRLGLNVEDLANAPIERAGFGFLFDPVAGEDASRVDACYLDDEGTAYDPEASGTGLTGRFAVFGVSGAPIRSVVGRFSGVGSRVSTRDLYIPEGGVVSMHPALVPF